MRLGWLRSGLIIVLVMALSLTFLFGIRSYRTLVLLQSAQQLGVVETSSIRAWMTLKYVAATYDVDEDVLVTQLQLPTGIDRQVTLRLSPRKKAFAQEILRRRSGSLVRIRPGEPFFFLLTSRQLNRSPSR
jgi:hypothetical protein